MVHMHFPAHGITITETLEGLEVRQNGRCYLAQYHKKAKWTLSFKVMNIISRAVHGGFDKLWAKNHPSPGNTTPGYICFARSHDERWDFLISRNHIENGPLTGDATVKTITVRNGKTGAQHKQTLDKHKIDYDTETRGARHLKVDPVHLYKLIKHL